VTAPDHPGEPARPGSAAGHRDLGTDAGGDEVLDLLGIGFGPSNLGLAIALAEPAATGPAAPLRAAFLERQPRFGWHRGMLIDDATMQVSFLKDLVTQRNPASDFSFVSYLHEQGRLTDFINHKTLFPLRIEFHDYLEWCASRLDHLVAYDREVIDVVPVDDDGVVVAFDVVARDRAGRTTVRRARDVVVAPGLSPRLPAGVTPGPRVWHNHDILARVETVPPTPAPRRFAVVGAGQSAAEVVGYLHRRFPTAEVCSIFARWGYTPADDSPYANRIFDPDAVDDYFGADEAVKRMLIDYHRNTNYSVVDGELIEDLYRREYQERVLGRPRLRMLNASRVVATDPRPDAVDVEVESLATGERTRLEVDALVYATGYEPADVGCLLGEAGKLLVRREDGTPAVERDYRLRLDVPAAGALYAQGGTEHTHGISSTLLSNIALRAGEIVASVVARRAEPVVRRPVGAGVTTG
jgi:L-ornithine N5-monooxygenase